MRPIFITASNTGVGKTHSAMLLIDALVQRGLNVGVYKPIETGVQGEPTDAAALLKRSGFDATLSEVCPYQFALPAAPYVAKTREIDLEFLKKRCDELATRCDILIIEGAGGLLTPIAKDFFMVDLASLLDAKVLFVTHSGLGCISDFESGELVLKERGASYLMAINLYREADSFECVSLPYFTGVEKDFYILQRDLERIIKALV